MIEAEISQAELDKQDYLNEAVQVPLTLFRLGGLDEVYRRYDGRKMRPPKEHFGYEPVEGFPTRIFDAYTVIFNRKLAGRSFTERSFMQLLVIAYRLVGRMPPNDVIEMSNGVKHE